MLASLATIAVVVAGLLVAPAANAAVGDYTFELTGPSTAQIRTSVTYRAQINAEAIAGSPATGIVLQSVLAPGLAFDPTSVDTSPSSPVASVAYDSATRTISFTLRDLVTAVSAFDFSATQVQPTLKSDQTVLTTTMTGNASSNGVTPPPDSVDTAVTGDYNYHPTKSATTLVGSNNRLVTYNFNVITDDFTAQTATFTTAAQRLMDSFPAGTILRGVSTSQGSWDTSIAVGETATGPWTATWTNNGTYGPGAPLTTNVNITVEYPESAAFPNGSLPPLNTVELEVLRVGGDPANDADWRQHTVPGSRVASAQGPQLGPGSGPVFGSAKTTSAPTVSAGTTYSWYRVASSFLAGNTNDELTSWHIQDALADSGNAAFWGHTQIKRVDVTPNPTLRDAQIPVTVDYRYSMTDDPTFDSGWQTVGNGTPKTFITGVDPISVLFNTAGSVNYREFSSWFVETIPVGAVVTGWRINVGTDTDPAPSGSQLEAYGLYIPLYQSWIDGSTSAGALTNTATITGETTSGTALTPGMPRTNTTFVDSAYVATNVKAPTSLQVNGTGNYVAGIANLNPQQTYNGAQLRVVLPVGVKYDASVGASRANTAVSGTGQAVPEIGDGVSVDATGTITDADGEHQVVILRFDELPSMRPVGDASDRFVERDGYQYNIPVVVLAQAYDPADTTIPVESWAFVDDPAFNTVPNRGASPLIVPDTRDLDPNRTTIARAIDDTQLTTAGGLLISKQSSATGDDSSWALSSEAEPGATAFWQVFVSNVLPDPVTNVVLFDRMPYVGDNGDSEFDSVVAGAITGAPAGSTVEYSTDATSATTGTWTSVAAGAKAFRVTVPTITTGESFNLRVPTTVADDALFGDRATNDVTAEATYRGATTEFVSNFADITAAAAPSIALLKTTNGVEYAGAPGAIVATGSDVVWAYTVTNTGNVQIDDLVVADAFEDGAGATGSLTPTAVETGPLAPGASRTFTATETAVEGQYHNTATVTGVAVNADGDMLDVDVAPATDESWYFAGASGLTVVKTTNGEDVASAPGLSLPAGADVRWEYRVTNTGTLPLANVQLSDVDTADGLVVHEEVISSLAPGETVVVSASGTAIAGQYHNQVTVTAADPAGGENLTAADDSWYFGAAAVTPTPPPAGSVNLATTGGAALWLWLILAAMMMVAGGVVAGIARRRRS